MRDQMRTTLTKITGHSPTDVAIVCCDSQRHWTVYIGLGSALTPPDPHNPPPVGTDHLPPDILDLDSRFGQALETAMQCGDSSEDDSLGYALGNDPHVHALELQMRRYAVDHGLLLRRVLANSSAARQRRMAAHLLGYALRSSAQIDALDDATRDSDAEVRNNATRALYVLARSSPTVAAAIPPASFIAMLNSGIWGDRNKSSLLLASLTESRNPRLLHAIRVAALPSLIEMAHWHEPGHAYAPLVILGRIGRIEEETLNGMINSGQAEQIIKAALTNKPSLQACGRPTRQRLPAADRR